MIINKDINDYNGWKVALKQRRQMIVNMTLLVVKA